MPFLELGNHALVTPNKAADRKTKRVETAFKALHQQNLHEFGQVTLALKLLLRALAFVINKRLVTGVGNLSD